MKSRLYIVFCFLSLCRLLSSAMVGNQFVLDNIQYEITAEDMIDQVYEVKTIYYDTACVIVPEGVTYNGHYYLVTNVVLLYSSKTCGLRHYTKVDLSNVTHVTQLVCQNSALIDIDTLILPPNITAIPPGNFYTVDSIRTRRAILESDTLCPGIHRIFSTGTNDILFEPINCCVSLLELDLSSYHRLDLGQLNDFGAAMSNPFLERCILPQDVRIFPYSAFDQDYSLKELTIPDSLEQLSLHVADATLIDTLHLGAKVHYIDHAFALGWSSLKHISVDPKNQWFTSDNGVLYNANMSTLWHYPYSRDAEKYIVPLSTRRIENCAFCLQQIGITDWEQQQREFVSHLRKLILPSGDAEGIYEIGEYAFHHASIDEIENLEYTMVKNITIGCFSSSFMQSLALPATIETISAYAFFNMPNLVSIDLKRCTRLSYIGLHAFRNCPSLQSLDFLSCIGLNSLSDSLCANDSSLISVILPPNVNQIGIAAFYGCVSLQEIECLAATPISIDESVFEGVNKSQCHLKVPQASIPLYKAAPVWNEFFMEPTDIILDNPSIVEDDNSPHLKSIDNRGHVHIHTNNQTYDLTGRKMELRE